MGRPRSIAPSDDAMVELIDDYHRQQRRSPTVRDFQRLVGLASPSSAYRHLLRLKDLNLITLESGRARTLRRAETSVSGDETPVP